MVRDIGEAAGHLQGHEITPSTARVKVIVNGLKHLITETIVEFEDGSETLVSLKYEKLEKHFDICKRLSHERKDCTHLPTSQNISKVQDHHGEDNDKPQGRRYDNSRGFKVEARDYSRRLERHGWPFGDRVLDSSNNEARRYHRGTGLDPHTELWRPHIAKDTPAEDAMGGSKKRNSYDSYGTQQGRQNHQNQSIIPAHFQTPVKAIWREKVTNPPEIRDEGSESSNQNRE